MPGPQPRACRDAVINGLKHKLLVHLYRRAKHISDTTNSPFELRRFYQYFDQVQNSKIHFRAQRKIEKII